MRVHCAACGADFEQQALESASSAVCPDCGRDVATVHTTAQLRPCSPERSGSPGSGSAERLMDRVSERISRAAGVQKLQGFSLRETFSEVFTRHTDAEVERYFAVGGPDTTPSLGQIDVRWPKPWVFFRMFLLAVAAYVVFFQAWDQWRNLNLLPGLIFVGSFAIPFSTLVLFFEMNVRRNVSLFQVGRLVVLGGILGIVLSLLMYQLAFDFHMQWLGASVAGLVEEPGKLLALALVINKRRYRGILNGLLFGAAVGTGFAAFESAGYALRTALASGTTVMGDVIVSRGLLAPFGHIVWTGMCGAALWRVKGGEPFHFEMLKDPRFLRIFAAAVVLHMLWDSPLQLPFFGTYLILGFIAWIIVLGLVQEGLGELRDRQAQLLTGAASAAQD